MRTKEPKLLLTAATFQELHEKLPALDVAVPPHPAARGDTPEYFAMVRLLATIPLDFADFPLGLTKFDRPDFSLVLDTRSIGIEHVQAVSENAVQEAKLRATTGGSGAYMVRPTTVGEPHIPRKKLREEILKNKMPPPFIGDSVERNWAQAMEHFILTKMAKAQKTGYRVHDHHWLAIYDDWPAPALVRQHALKLLLERLPEVAPFAVFQRVFIMTGATLVELGPDVVRQFRVHDYKKPVFANNLRAPLAISPGGRSSALLSRRRLHRYLLASS